MDALLQRVACIFTALATYRIFGDVARASMVCWFTQSGVHLGTREALLNVATHVVDDLVNAELKLNMTPTGFGLLAGALCEITHTACANAGADIRILAQCIAANPGAIFAERIESAAGGSVVRYTRCKYDAAINTHVSRRYLLHLTAMQVYGAVHSIPCHTTPEQLLHCIADVLVTRPTLAPLVLTGAPSPYTWCAPYARASQASTPSTSVVATPVTPVARINAPLPQIAVDSRTHELARVIAVWTHPRIFGHCIGTDMTLAVLFLQCSDNTCTITARMVLTDPAIAEMVVARAQLIAEIVTRLEQLPIVAATPVRLMVALLHDTSDHTAAWRGAPLPYGNMVCDDPPSAGARTLMVLEACGVTRGDSVHMRAFFAVLLGRYWNSTGRRGAYASAAHAVHGFALLYVAQAVHTTLPRITDAVTYVSQVQHTAYAEVFYVDVPGPPSDLLQAICTEHALIDQCMLLLAATAPLRLFTRYSSPRPV